MRNPQFYVYGKRPMAAGWQIPFVYCDRWHSPSIICIPEFLKGLPFQYIERLDDNEIQVIPTKPNISPGVVPPCSNVQINSLGKATMCNDDLHHMTKKEKWIQNTNIDIKKTNCIPKIDHYGSPKIFVYVSDALWITGIPFVHWPLEDLHEFKKK